MGTYATHKIDVGAISGSFSGPPGEAMLALGLLGDSDSAAVIEKRLDEIDPTTRAVAFTTLARLEYGGLRNHLGVLDGLDGAQLPTCVWYFSQACEPELARKLKGQVLSRRRYAGTLRQIVEILARECSLKVEIENGVLSGENNLVLYLSPKMSFDEAMVQLANEGRVACVLEGSNTLRLLSLAKAVSYFAKKTR